MHQSFDVTIVGLGAMGSSAAYHLSVVASEYSG